MRRRIQATPTAAASGALNIGITLSREPGAQAGSGDSAITGPVVIPALNSSSVCSWLVMMRGVRATDTIEWAVTWDGMDDAYAGSVRFGVNEDDAEQPMVAQIVESVSGSITGILVYAVVNGVTFGPEGPFQCLV